MNARRLFLITLLLVLLVVTLSGGRPVSADASPCNYVEEFGYTPTRLGVWLTGDWCYPPTAWDAFVDIEDWHCQPCDPTVWTYSDTYPVNHHICGEAGHTQLSMWMMQISDRSASGTTWTGLEPSDDYERAIFASPYTVEIYRCHSGKWDNGIPYDACNSDPRTNPDREWVHWATQFAGRCGPQDLWDQTGACVWMPITSEGTYDITWNNWAVVLDSSNN